MTLEGGQIGDGARTSYPFGTFPWKHWAVFPTLNPAWAPSRDRGFFPFLSPSRPVPSLFFSPAATPASRLPNTRI